MTATVTDNRYLPVTCRCCGAIVPMWIHARFVVSGWHRTGYGYGDPVCQDCAGDRRRMKATCGIWLLNRGLRCAQCDRLYQPERADGRYCSGACRQKAYRARLRERAS